MPHWGQQHSLYLGEKGLNLNAKYEPAAPGVDLEGVDTLRGSGGLDAIFSRDASADSVSCGESPDALAVDPFDTLAPDSEISSPAPAPSGSPAGTGPGATAGPVLRVRVPRQSRRMVSAKGLRVVLSCSTACRASGRLLANRATARRLGLGAAAASRPLRRLQPLALTAGSPRQTRVRLTRAWRRALLRARSARFR